MAGSSFDLNDALKFYLSDPTSIPTPEVDDTLADYENDPESLSGSAVGSVLDGIVDSVAENPDAISRPSHMDSLQFLLK